MSRTTIGIIGLGYVGQVLLASFSYHGYNVVGVDISDRVISALRKGKPTIYEEKIKDYLQYAHEEGYYTVSSDYDDLDSADLIFITVNTNLNSDGYMDLSTLRCVAENLVPVLKKSNHYVVLIVKSTVLPGTTRNIFIDFLSKETDLLFREDFGVAVNPEFLREGTAIYDLEQANFVVIGSEDKYSGDLVESFWREFYGVVGSKPTFVRTSIETAELTKLVFNAFLATKISFANMIADLCEKIPNTDVDGVMRIIGLDPRISPQFFGAGLGFGGSCLPKDLKALIKFGERRNVDMNLLKSVAKINERRVDWVINILKKYNVKKQQRVLVLGLSFKPRTNDVRGSIGIKIAKKLIAEGYTVSVYDPVAIPNARQQLGMNVEYMMDLDSAITEADVIIIATEWQEFKEVITRNMDRIRKNVLIIDGRRLLIDLEKELVMRNIQYITIGRQKFLDA